MLAVDSQREDRGLTRDHLQEEVSREPHQEDDGSIQEIFGERGVGMTIPLPRENLGLSLTLLNQMALIRASCYSGMVPSP